MVKSSFYDCLEKSKTKMSCCDHVFIKLKDGIYSGACNSSDCEYFPAVVECLKCGLTNKYIYMNPLLRDIYIYDYHRKLAVDANNEIFWKQYGSASRRSGKDFDDSVFNLISDEEFNVYRPSADILYAIAKKIKPKGNKAELFAIMKELNGMIQAKERETIRRVSQAKDLIKRYKARVRKIDEKK